MFESETRPLIMPSSVIRGSYTDRGPQREENQDACALPPVAVDEERLGTLLVVADGVGGRAGGAAASRDAVHYLQALYYAKSGSEQHDERLRQSVEMVNALNRLTQQRLGQTGGRLTTLVAAVVYHDRIWVANVGDSRAYLVRASNGQRRQLTEDHSQYNQLIKAGLVDENLKSEGVITQAIGLKDQLQVDIYRYHWQPGDRLILCSDGLSSLRPEVMADMALNYAPQEAAQALVFRANVQDGSDNSTAIVAGWGSRSDKQKRQDVGPSWKRTFFYMVAGFLLGGVLSALLLLYYVPTPPVEPTDPITTGVIEQIELILQSTNELIEYFKENAPQE